MGLFLQAVGLVSLLFLGLIVVSVFVVRAKLRRFVRALESLDQATARTSSGINLVQLSESEWASAANQQAIVNALAGPGFQPIGSTIEATGEEMKRQALEDLDEAVRERFLKQSSMSAEDWEHVRERLVIVHDRLDPAMLDERVSEWVDEDEDGYPPSAENGQSIRDIFTAYNTQLPASRRFVKLGEVSEPIEAEVYAAPEG
jgi:hypothetical protein